MTTRRTEIRRSFIRYTAFLLILSCVSGPIMMGSVSATTISPESQTVAKPTLEFEVVSIKEANPSDGIRMGCHGIDGASPGIPLGRCIGNRISMLVMIGFAYKVTGSLISGGPSWIRSKEFDLQAKAKHPENTTSDQFRLMFQTLLTDRFKLKFHTESKEMAGYVLGIAKNGAKLEPAEGEEGSQRTVNRNGDSELNAKKTSMAVFARYLSSRIGRPVLDKTGLDGDYQFQLIWTPAEGELNFNPGRVDLAGPTIFTAIKDQLGLVLESQKVPVDVLVIDHAEMPIPE